MLGNRKKLTLVICLFFGLLFLFACFINAKQLLEIVGNNREQLPIRSLTITIDPDQREKLFSQLQKFADKHGLEYMMSDFGTGGERFTVEMLGNHIKILADDTPKAPTLIAIDFYDQTRANPVSEVTLETIDNLLDDLESFISEIPNVIISEKPR
jgi:hypothetical protein